MVRGTCEDRRPTALNTPRRKRTGEGGESLLLCKQTITSLPEECSAQILQGARPEECLAQGQEGQGTSRRESLCVLNRPAPTVVPRPPVEVGGPCSPIHPLPRLRHPPPDARLSHLTGRGGGQRKFRNHGKETQQDLGRPRVCLCASETAAQGEEEWGLVFRAQSRVAARVPGLIPGPNSTREVFSQTVERGESRAAITRPEPFMGQGGAGRSQALGIRGQAE